MSLPGHPFLTKVLNALEYDVPKGIYDQLSQGTVQHARRELEKLLEAIPGANFQNVKFLRTQMTVAEQGNWSSLNKGAIEDAILEYQTLLKVGRKQTHDIIQSEKELKTSPDEHSVTKINRNNSDTQNDENDVPVPTLTHVDTAELLIRKREKEKEKTDPDNEDVPMPKLKHVDTAEILRRSRDARKKLCDANPSIADLSDVYRLTRLAEMYSQSYDNEWTDALEELMKLNVTEKEAIQQLLQYLQDAFSHCEEEVEQIISKHEEEKSDQSVSERLKNITDEEMNNLQKKIGDKINKGNHNQIVRCYIDECVRLTYFMNVQNPPMKLYRVEKDTEFDSNVFRQYTRTGKTVDYVVWPALLLCEKGPVASKGVVQVT